MSGQTIEVLNTDAEGRLVLADALLVHAGALQAEIRDRSGHADRRDHGGAGRRTCRPVLATTTSWPNASPQAGREEGEPVWRLPLGDGYDKLLKSKIADMKNIGGPHAGSITAAQFLQRFVEGKTPWAHLDIAGVAWQDGEKKAADPELGHRLGRARPEPAGRGPLRELMTETLFYHLERRESGSGAARPGREVARARLARADPRRQRRARRLPSNKLLWTYNDESFLAHALEGDGDAARQPVLITVEEQSRTGADMLFLVGGAQPPVMERCRARRSDPHRADVRRPRSRSCSPPPAPPGKMPRPPATT